MLAPEPVEKRPLLRRVARVVFNFFNPYDGSDRKPITRFHNYDASAFVKKLVGDEISSYFIFKDWRVFIYKLFCGRTPPPLEAILVIFGRRALIFFLFESSWKKMKNDATSVRMRGGDQLGDAKMSKKGTSLRRI